MKIDDEVHLCPDDNAHIDRRFDEVMALLKKMSTAFVAGADGQIDYEGHRRFHEEKIRAARAEARFWEELRLDIAKKGLWSLLVVLLGLAVVGVSVKLGIHK